MASCGQPNGADLKVLADVLALLAGPNEIEHATADGVLGDIAGVAHLRERTNVTGAGAVDDLAPVGVIGLGELREEPLQGAVCGILHLVGQLDAVGLLPAAEKDLRAADDVTEQFLNAVPGDFQMGLDGLAGLDGLRRRRPGRGRPAFPERRRERRWPAAIPRGGAAAGSRRATGYRRRRHGHRSGPIFRRRSIHPAPTG